ncbi:hypothetical protein ACEWY4_024287 [Coilia grayii]|uniref:IF rod domain-containing protein n=1 Tax=Coilia grayii TaxID=363190 RepID=A0ABD1IZY2_9TELE
MMSDQEETDFFFDPSTDSLMAEALQFQPLFICEEPHQEHKEVKKEEEKEEEEEEEERFEDCVEDLQTALGFSRRCRAAMEEEFSGLMAQMMAEIEEYDSLLHSATTGCSLLQQGAPDVTLPSLLLQEELFSTAGHRGMGAGAGGGALTGERSMMGVALLLQEERRAIGGGALAGERNIMGGALLPLPGDRSITGGGAMAGDRSVMGGAVLLQGERSAKGGGALTGERSTTGGALLLQGERRTAGGALARERSTMEGTVLLQGERSAMGGALAAESRSMAGGAVLLQAERSTAGGALARERSTAGGSASQQGENSTEGGAEVVQRSSAGGAAEMQGERSAEDPLLQLLEGDDLLLKFPMGDPSQPPHHTPAEQEEDTRDREGVVLSGVMGEVEGEVERDLGALGELFEGCIEEVGRLEQRRDELVAELLELERPLAVGVQALREELSDARAQLQSCGLQKEDLKESMRLLKRQLFAVAKACAQSQVELSSQKHQVKQLSAVQEELQAQVQALTDEAVQLRSEHQTRLHSLQEQQEAQTSSSTSSSADLSHGRRASCDLQQYLQGALSALEEWYEPRLVALLKRREGGQEALRRAREQAQELRGQLGPLRDEHQKLQLQRACLEERFRLMEDQRLESLEHYKETVDHLEESSRELKMELQLQRRKTKEMEALKDSLMKQLCLYRESTQDHGETEALALGDHGSQQPSMVEVQT